MRAALDVVSGARYYVILPILQRRYLESRVTADDRGALAQPYGYTRYYERLSGEIEEDVCLFD